MLVARAYHRATLLRNGKVVFLGGILSDSSGLRGISRVDLFDPLTRGFLDPASLDLSDARFEHSATLLLDGRFLDLGGTDDFHSSLQTAELFDEGRGQQPAWTPTISSFAFCPPFHCLPPSSPGRLPRRLSGPACPR